MPTCPEPVEAALLPPHDDDDRAFSAADEGDERREVELPVHLDRVGDRLGQRECAPHVVETRAEDRQAVRTLAIEFLSDIAPDALEVVPEAQTLLVRELSRVRTVCLRSLVEERVQTRVRIVRGRRSRRIEAQIEADGAAVLSLERREAAKLIPGDRPCHPVCCSMSGEL